MNAFIVLEDLQRVDNDVAFQWEVRKPMTFENEKRQVTEIHSKVNKFLKFMYLCFKGNMFFSKEKLITDK